MNTLQRGRGWLAGGAIAGMAMLFSLGDVAAARPKRAAAQPAAAPAASKVQVAPGLSQAALAAQLALVGEKRRSPVLLLAAAEILSSLKESPRKVEAKVKPGSVKDTSAKQPLLDVHGLLDKARQYAKGDAKLLACVESRSEQFSSRGLILKQGEKLPSVEVAKITFKVIGTGLIAPDKYFELSNVIFEGNAPAAIVVVGDGDGDLDLWVYDESAAKIGTDTGAGSRCAVAWMQKQEGAVTVQIANVGKASERFVLLANW